MRNKELFRTIFLSSVLSASSFVHVLTFRFGDSNDTLDEGIGDIILYIIRNFLFLTSVVLFCFGTLIPHVFRSKHRLFLSLWSAVNLGLVWWFDSSHDFGRFFIQAAILSVFGFVVLNVFNIFRRCEKKISNLFPPRYRESAILFERFVIYGGVVVTLIGVIFLLFYLVFLLPVLQKRSDRSILQKVRVDCSDTIFKPQNELERRLIEIYRKHMTDSIPFNGVLVPWRKGGGGFGNSLMGTANAILISLFTESTVHIHPGLGFYDPIKHPVFRYFRPRNQFLCENMQFPPSQSSLVKKIESGRHYGLTPFLSFKLQKFLGGGYFWEYMLSHPDERDKADHLDNNFFSDRTRSLYPMGCFEYICFDHIISEKFNQMPKSHDFFVLWDFRAGWYPIKVWNSKAKTKHLCEDLELCQGIDVAAIDRYRRHKVLHYNSGFRLISNLFHSLFEFTPEVKGLVRSSFGDHLEELEQKKDSTLLISFNHRNFYLRNLDDTDVVKCLEHVILQQFNKKKCLQTVKIFISFDVNGKAEEVEERFFERQKESGMFGTHKNIQFLYNDIGRPEQRGIRGKKAKDENRFRLSMDLYMLTQGSVHIVSEESTFGTFGTILSKSFLEGERPYVIPSFKNPDFRTSREDFPNICSQDIPMQICREKNCPLDYSKRHFEKHWGEEMLKEYSWYEDRMKDNFDIDDLEKGIVDSGRFLNTTSL